MKAGFVDSARDVLFSNTGFLVSWSGVRLSAVGSSATIWPTVAVPDDR
jgi:hypothetical protein